MNRNELPQALHAALDHIENCIVRTFLTKETTHAWDTICAAFGSRPAESAAPGAVDDSIAEYDRMRDGVGGCSDGGCVIKTPVGMHTNGGCKCWTDKMKAQRMMHAGQKLRAALARKPDGPRVGGGDL
jgi:hypothetical protein